MSVESEIVKRVLKHLKVPIGKLTVNENNVSKNLNYFDVMIITSIFFQTDGSPKRRVNKCYRFL